jgi:hypothetical protein
MHACVLGLLGREEEQLVFRKEWFPNLETLFLKDLPHLKRLEIEEVG